MTREGTGRPVAIGARLKKCPHIRTLGFRPNFTDYSPEERERLMASPRVLFPTAFYADLFNALGKPTFPSYHTYKFALDKIRQTTAFQMQGIPHPRTRVFYGKRQKQAITDYFSFPFIAKIPRGSARGAGVFLIKTRDDLDACLDREGPAYIQEYLPIDRDMRIIVIGKKVVLSYWRIASGNGFLTNLAQGGEISFEKLPQEALDLALHTAECCGWDDVGIDIIRSKGNLYVLEGNMKYGTKGFRAAGIDYKKLLADRIIQGKV